MPPPPPTPHDLDRLVAEIAALRAELAQERQQTHTQISALTAEISRLIQLLAQANERNAELTAIAQRKKRKPAAAAKDVPPPPPLEPEAAVAFENRPAPPPIPEKPKPEPKPRRPTGRKPLPAHLPAEETTLYPPCCDACGGKDLEIREEVVEEKLTVVKEHQRRRVVHRKTGRCRTCSARTTAPAPPAPFPRSKVTCEWLAWFIVQKFFLLVPLDRIRRDLALRGVPLSISFLVSQVERAADLLAPVDGEHWKQLLAGPWMQSDATSLKVIVPEIEGTHSGYLEVYRREEIVVFQYEASKDGETQAKKLSRFRGLLLVDAEHRYNEVFETLPIAEAGCNAHGRRKFRDAEAVQPILAVEGGQFISAMYVAENAAQEQGLTGDALRAWRQAEIQPITATFQVWLDAVEPTLTPSDPLLKGVRYYQRHGEALRRFLDHPELPLDNSACEREFQTVAKARASWLFAGGTEGAHRAAVLLGIVASCRSLQIDIQSYLTWAFERLGTHKAQFGLSAAQLTPAAYRAARAPPDG